MDVIGQHKIMITTKMTTYKYYLLRLVVKIISKNKNDTDM